MVNQGKFALIQEDNNKKSFEEVVQKIQKAIHFRRDDTCYFLNCCSPKNNYEISIKKTNSENSHFNIQDLYNLNVDMCLEKF